MKQNPCLRNFKAFLRQFQLASLLLPSSPPQLLQKFLQWRQKANSTETSQ